MKKAAILLVILTTFFYSSAQERLKVTQVPTYLCNCKGFYAESDSVSVQITFDYPYLYKSKLLRKFNKIKVNSIVYLNKDSTVNYRNQLYYYNKLYKYLKKYDQVSFYKTI